MFLSNPFIGAFGLDIGDLSIKLLQLEKRWSLKTRQTYFTIKEMRSATLPPGYIVNGEIQQPEMVRKKILNLIGAEGNLKPIRSPWVVADLPEPKTFLKLIEIGTCPKDITAEDIKFQAKNHLPFDLEDSYLDWQVINDNDPKAEISQVLIGTVPKVIADSYTYLLESAGLNPLALEIEGLSLARALITANKEYKKEARAILDLGATRSSVLIYDRDSLQFSTNINFSGELINTALQQNLKIGPAEAEQLKIKTGLKYSKKQPGYLKTISGLTGQLITDLKKIFTFYQEHFPHANPITHITMCGGLANWENLDTILAEKLAVTAHPGHAWKNLFNDKITPEQENEGIKMSSAIGLALRAANNPLRSEDL